MCAIWKIDEERDEWSVSPKPSILLHTATVLFLPLPFSLSVVEVIVLVDDSRLVLLIVSTESLMQDFRQEKNMRVWVYKREIGVDVYFVYKGVGQYRRWRT